MKRHWSVLLVVGMSLVACGLSKKMCDANVEHFRKHHLKELVEHERAPLDEGDLKNVRFFDPDGDYRVHAKVKLNKGQETIIMPTSSGKEKTFMRFATAEFILADTIYNLTLFQNVKLLEKTKYRDHLFLPFKDLSNGETTYGGGRYIDLSVKDIKDNQVIIDFNKCYNPWCSYSDGYNCPVPPIENHLNVEILAGEKAYAGSKRKI